MSENPKMTRAWVRVTIPEVDAENHFAIQEAIEDGTRQIESEIGWASVEVEHEINDAGERVLTFFGESLGEGK